jgi:hypothetical protein
MESTESEMATVNFSSHSDLGPDVESGMEGALRSYGTSQIPVIIMMGDVDHMQMEDGDSNQRHIMSLLRRVVELPNVKLLTSTQPASQLTDMVDGLRSKDDTRVAFSDLELKDPLDQYTLWQSLRQKPVDPAVAKSASRMIRGDCSDRSGIPEYPNTVVRNVAGVPHLGNETQTGVSGIIRTRQALKVRPSRHMKRTQEVVDTRTCTVSGWSAIKWIYKSIYLWIPGIFSQEVDDLLRDFEKCIPDIQQQLNCEPDTLTRDQLNDLLPDELPISSITSQMHTFHGAWTCFRDTMMYAWTLAVTVSIAIIAYVRALLGAPLC